MKYNFGDTIVIALGGSVIYPDEIDTEFIKEFKAFAEEFVKDGRKLVIVIGGGKLARLFQDAAHQVALVDNEDKDWLGIHSTRLNGHLLRTIFKDTADPVVIDERGKIEKPTYPITIASGWRPGWSTDYVAMQLAADFGISEMIVAGKPAFVYDKDPHQFEGAAAIPEISWKDYRKLIPTEWIPGLNAPVDPIASALGEEKNLKAIIVNGKNLPNFQALLKGEEFEGTIIE